MPDPQKQALQKATSIGPDPNVPSREGLTGLVNWLISLGIPIYPEQETTLLDLAAAVPAVKPLTSLKALAAGEKAAVGGKRLGTLARTLTPGEAKGVYHLREPTVERLNDIYRIGTAMPSTSNWAGAASEELLQAFGGDREAALRWARLWGATSPNTSVPVNTRESISALIWALEHPGQELTADVARLLPEANITMAGSKVPNINRALIGEPLSPGTKVEAMAGFMAGQPRIPIDVHALYALGAKGDKLDPEYSALRTLMTRAEGLPARGGLTNVDIYRRYEDAMKRALTDIAPNRSINQVFAELWEGARAHKGLKPQGGPIDILRQKGLLQMGAMLDPARLKAALRQQGWTASAIGGLMLALGVSDGAEAATP